MKIFSRQKKIRALFLCAAISSFAAFFVFAPVNFRSQAESKRFSGKTDSRANGLENYDIRTDAKDAARKSLEDFRQSARANGALIFESDKLAAAENNLRKRVPTLQIERSEDLRQAETIATDVKNGRAFLSEPTSANRPDVLRAFIAGSKDLFGLNEKQIAELEQTKDYTNPDGVLSFAQFEQKISGVPVFRGEVKAAFTKQGEIVRVINNLAPDLDYNALSTDFKNASDAVKSAAANINYELKAEDLNVNETTSTDLKRVFGASDWATTAEKMYFPIESGVARAAWRVLIWEKTAAFYVIVDAETGAMLWRKNITEDQTQAATFSVYTNSNAMINVAKNPFPLNPGITNPGLATQGAAINRATITRVGNEAPYTFNNNGWITDGGADTDGNAVEAGIDRDNVDGVDARGKAAGGANRNFVFDYAPGNPNTNSGDAPVPAAQTYPISAFQAGAVVQLFYICNWFHDETYRLGFTEAAGNFQTDNFGRGGSGGDRVSAEAQDSSGFNNANFSPPADGSRGKMQMYLWNGPNPDFDGDLDADVVVHEFAHGLSNRLHGNSSGLNTNMARAMGEGWSDFYALSLLSQPTDPIGGIYPMGGYATYLGGGGGTYTANNYYGIRRFPKAVISAVGANGKPHNPLTFRQINPPCNTEIGTASAIGTISAFARGTFGSAMCDQVHAAGEVWSSALWEVRARFVERLGWETGNRKILQIVTDAMKISALNPTFLQSRDAIIAAAQASGSSADVADVWSGFARRGMGFSATIAANGGGANNASVSEAFDTPNVAQTPNFTINDQSGNNNGYADAGETISLNVPLTNTTGKTASNVTLQINGGAAANYGDIANNQTVTRAVSLTVPANQSCGSLLNLTFNIDGGLGAKTETRDLFVGNGNAAATFSEKFDNVSAPNVPSGWTVSAASPNEANAAAWTTSAATTNASAPNALFAPDPAGYYSAQIESPAVPISVSAARLKFKINYNTEAGWDGATLDIKIGNGAYQDITDAGGKFIAGAYPRYLAGTSASNLFPNATRRAWTGSSNGFQTVEIYLPASAKNQTVRFRWTASSDVGVAGVGTYIDDVEVFAAAGACGGAAAVSKTRADYDGDGRTDFSVYRAGEGNWYIDRSRDGFTALNWGFSSDKPVGGDFDGDGRTDVAVYRPSTGVWFISKSSDNQLLAAQFGLAEDKPVPNDYDGDGKADMAVYRPSSGVWYIARSRDGFLGLQFGISSDAPAPADYDGDGKTDVAVYRDGLWIINQSTGGVIYASFGLSGDKAVPADYDGDGKADIAVWRPSDGVWYVQQSRDGFKAVQFGTSSDVIVPGDYDGDGKTDPAFYRAGAWYVAGSRGTLKAGNFGVPSDAPVPNSYIP